MIFYFSATGNSKHVASLLAQATGEELVSIEECRRDCRFEFEVEKQERIGFVTPVYFWGLPSIVVDFIERISLNLHGQPYVYHVLTYGTTTGKAHYMMKELLKKKGLNLGGRFIVRMVDTWTPLFDVSDMDKCRRTNMAAEAKIRKVEELVIRRIAGDYDSRKFPHALAGLYYKTYESQRRTARFWLKEERCIGCELCAKRCPENAIEMRQGKPAWVKDKCIMCLGCLHRCPGFAIQYGRHTAKHGQYLYSQTMAGCKE